MVNNRGYCKITGANDLAIPQLIHELCNNT